MGFKGLVCKTLALLLLTDGGLLTVKTAKAEIREVTFGVLAFRGKEHAHKRWGATIDHLNEEIPNLQFVLKPLSLEGMREAVAHDELDVVLTNPGHYVELEAAFGTTRIVTLENLRAGQPYTEFGAVIISRADRPDIRKLQDLRGKSFMAVNPRAFGGYYMAWRELKDAGVDPGTDFSRLVFNGFPQDRILFAVRDGKVDAGTVRTDLIESMAAKGLIKQDDFRILNARTSDGFPFVHSTRLYPEWPLAKTRRFPDHLAQEVAVALMTMDPSNRAALQGNYAGWTVPLDYSRVHELFRALGVGPYHSLFSFEEVVREQWHWGLMLVLLIVALFVMFAYSARLNRELKQSSASLQRELAFHRKAQHELLKLSSALEQTADTVMITDKFGVIEYVNPAFERVTGFSVEEAVGKQSSLIKSGEHDSAFYLKMWETIARGEVYRDLFVNKRKDGTLVYEEKTITPLKNHQDEIEHYISTGKDVTEKRTAEQSSRQHQENLAHVSRVSMMGEMASSIAHELNQPLAAIANYAQGCVRRLSGDDYKVGQIIAALENISQQSTRSGEIIRRLRSFVSKGEPKRSRADINQIVQNAASLAYFEARKKGVILRLNLGNDLPPVNADVIQIEQVVLNLIRNAIEAMAKNLWNKRELRIHTWCREDKEIEVAVWDTGHGLLPEDHKRLFDAFFTTKREGMGMGLSISRSIVEVHGGSLTANNNQGQGATFRFTLPILQDGERTDENDVAFSHAS